MIKYKQKEEQYVDYIARLYSSPEEKMLPYFTTRNVTFQVTDDCPMACTYCYQTHKGHKIMTEDVAKKGVDLLFQLYEKNEGIFINKNTKAITFEFIGGEPLMNIEIIDFICSYFLERCIKENHPWLLTWRISMISNGALYFDKKVQQFLEKFRGFISFSITLDGPKEIHDACRVYHDGHGNFDDAYKAMKHFNSTYYENLGTKVTIAPENLSNLNKIVEFFVNEGMYTIHANCTYEAKWNEDNAKLFYNELKQMADYLLKLNDGIYVSLFDEFIGHALTDKDNQNWCGGTGDMLAFDPDGIAYPCLRYMSSSLGEDQPPIIIGSVDGLWITDEQKQVQEELNNITRRSQSTDECYYCPIASGCAWCSAWNYQCYGTPNKRCTNICIMHKARVLANVYYWNKYYQLNNINDKFELNLPKEECLKIIDEDEYNMLINLY